MTGADDTFARDLACVDRVATRIIDVRDVMGWRIEYHLSRVNDGRVVFWTWQRMMERTAEEWHDARES